MYIVYICILAPLIQNGFSFEEVDLNSLSSYETLDQNFEIWNNEENSISRFEEICKNSTATIYVSEEDITIDCKLLKEKEAEHFEDRIKRSADEVEGSGEIDPKETLQENDTKLAITVTTPDIQTTDVEIISEVLTENDNETETAEDVKTNSEEVVTTNPYEATHPSEITKKIETPISPPKIQETTDVKKPVTELPTTVVMPSEQKEAEVEAPKQNDKNEDVKKEVEILKGHQGKTLISSQEAKEDNDKSIKTDESTQKAGSKDTTILVVLFVAVVVVGALAFGYNFIKKRKRQSNDLERVEKSSIKHSLQNLTKLENNEPEKKPLMDDNKDVEMVDMKKENVEEKIENGPSEVKVQS